MYSAFKKTVLLFNNISIVELTKCLYEKKTAYRQNSTKQCRKSQVAKIM